jgi:hypothetical protein
MTLCVRVLFPHIEQRDFFAFKQRRAYIFE